MVRYLPVILIALLMIYCVVEIAQANGQQVRNLPKWAWFVAVVFLPLAGCLGWLFLGRPISGPGKQPPPGRPRAPDDDPDFLRGL
ncbi:PLD nuclease N-terminal domain-containing protein [Enemella sp. A6]|uniref:PLD nuclease N-terminal domain-containing protein n=1 Tax=Enemella sp. A6 TaxID=3440152 RepID=UPI003EBA5D8E